MITQKKLYLDRETMDNIQKLVDDGYIRCSTHPDIPELKIYNYSKKTQFEHAWNTYTKMCRGLVVDDKRRVVILCPEKFFNEGEPEAPSTEDWRSTCILEKLDGYYVSIRKDHEYGLIVTTRGSFDSKYVRAAKKLMPNPNDIQYDRDFFCELCQNFEGDEKLIVTKHDKPRLVLWGIGSTPPIDGYSHWDVAKRMSRQEVSKYLRGKVEGVVVFNWETLERVKVKTPWYLETHRLVSGLSKRNVFTLWRNHKSASQMLDAPEEYEQMIRGWEDEFTDIYFGQYLYPAKTLNVQWKHKTDKEFAVECDAPKNLKTIVFALRKGQDYHEMICRMMSQQLRVDATD